MWTDLSFIISTAVLAGVSLWRYRLQITVVNVVQGTWVLLMAVPSALQFSGVETAAKERLFVSTTIVNVALLTAVLLWSSGWFQSGLDWLKRRLPEQGESGGRGLPCWFWGALGVSLLVFLVHAMLMPRIPLVGLVFRSDLTPVQLAELREQANKMLAIPLPLKYLFNWNVRVLVPILLTFMVIRGNRHVKILGFPILLGLSAMTLEKTLPAFAVISCAFGLAIYRRTSLGSPLVLMGIIVGLGLAAALNAAISSRGDQPPTPGASQVVAEQSAPPQERPAVGHSDESDSNRLRWSPVRFIYRRTLRIPSEVAYAWFEYFPDISGGFVHGRSWFPLDRSRPGFQHPAQAVGLYAYHKKDPAHYLQTIHAYGAFHADAWANFGYPGVVVASILLISLLAIAEVALELTRSLLSAAAGGAGLSILVVTLPSGGLQAVLIAQGLVVCLAILVTPIWQGLSITNKELITSEVGH